jgi:exosortase
MSSVTLTADKTTETDNRLLMRLLAVGLSALVFILLFAVWPYQHWQWEHRGSVLEGWVKTLSMDANAEWQFCFLVPLIVAFLIYRQKEVLKVMPLQGSWWGVPVLAFAMIVYWLGYKADTGYLGFAAIQFSLAGLILLLAGKSWMKVLFLPWIFLIFAWPFFPMDGLLASKLKIPTAQIAGLLMQLLGMDVVREGSAIQSAADFAAGIKQGDMFVLEVADSCSGMRSLYALIMVGVLYSFLALKGTLPRVLLSLSTIPLAVIGNVVRLVLLAVGCLVFGQDIAVGKTVNGEQEESFYHLLAGYVVFGVALAGMFALATLLEGKHWKKLKAFGLSKRNAISGPDSALPTFLLKSGAVVLLALGGMGLCWATPSRPTLADAGFKPELPASVNDYTGRELPMTSKEKANFDEGVILKRREYISSNGRGIMGTMVISGIYKKTLHEPHICLPNAGWIVAETREVPVHLADGRVLNANLMRIFRDYQKESGERVRLKALNLYWYEGSDGTRTPNYTLSNILSYTDGIFRNLNHRWSQAAFFMPISEREVGMDDPMEEVMALQELSNFVGKAAPEFLLNP